MQNKLAWLGFLGVLGFAGFFGNPFSFAFCANFTFFRYIKVVPDELFWTNVRICATRGFFIFLIASNFIIIATVLLIEKGLYTYAQSVAIVGFSLTMAVCVIVFSASLGHLERKEMIGKDEDDH